MDSIPFIVSPTFCSLSYPLDTPLIPFRCGQLAAEPDSCARLLSQAYLFSPEGNTRSFNVGAASRVWHGRIAGAYRHWKVSLDFYAMEILNIYLFIYLYNI